MGDSLYVAPPIKSEQYFQTGSGALEACTTSVINWKRCRCYYDLCVNLNLILVIDGQPCHCHS